MARIIENDNNRRRIIKLSTDDVLTVVREYQIKVPRGIEYSEVRSCLEDIVIYIPEDV